MALDEAGDGLGGGAISFNRRLSVIVPRGRKERVLRKRSNYRLRTIRFGHLEVDRSWHENWLSRALKLITPIDRSLPRNLLSVDMTEWRCERFLLGHEPKAPVGDKSPAEFQAKTFLG